MTVSCIFVYSDFGLVYMCRKEKYVKKILKKPLKIVPVGMLALTLTISGVAANIHYAGAEQNEAVGYNIDTISKDGSNQLTVNQYPDFSNEEAYKNSHYGQKALFGQCTWFASGRFYEMYGYQPEFTGDGYMCVDQLLAKHGDKFYRSDRAVLGAIGSSDYWHNHVWVVVGVDEDGNGVTVQEGNLDQMTNDWVTGCSDWHEKHYTYDELRASFGQFEFANPNTDPNTLAEEAKKAEEAKQKEEKKQETVKTAVDALTGDSDSVKKVTGNEEGSKTHETSKEVSTNMGGAASLIVKPKENPVESAKSIKDVDASKNKSVQEITNTLIKAMS